MKNLSSIFLAAAMLLAATNSFASGPMSRYKPGEKIKLFSNEEFFSKADYIIELRPAGREYTTYDAGGNSNPNEIYTSLLFIVTEVYKNDETMRISRGDTINFLRKGGTVVIPSKEHPLDGEGIVAPEPVDYDTGEMGGVLMMPDEYQSILFMKKSDFPKNPDASKRNKYPKVSMLQDIARASIKIGGRGIFNGPIWGLNGLHFENRYELYKYMEQFEGVKVPLSDINHMRWYLTEEAFNKYLKERNVKWQDPNSRQHVDSLNRIIEMKSQKIKEYREKNSRQGLLRASQANNTLTVTIKNQRVTYDHNDSKYYFHFDVYINANNSSTYLDYFSFNLNYNTNAFNTNGTVSNGATFDTYTYSPNGYFDNNQLTLGIITRNVANLSRTQLTTTPVELLKMKIELKNNLLGVPSGINFNFVSGSWFTTASNTPWDDYGNYWDYDAINVNNPPGFTIYTVAPTLSNFTPTTTRAGTGETITITGTNFGTQKGEVLFTKDGIASGTTDYLKGLDSTYIDSWTNTQITVRVPSFVRKGYINPNGTAADGYGSGAGTGKIKVKTARNDSVISANNLNIEYSVTNFSGRYEPSCYTNPICRVYLARLSSDCNYDIVFTLDNSFQDPLRAGAIKAVEDALEKWSDLLGIRLALDYNYVNGFVGGKNVIGFASLPSGSPPNASMVTKSDEIWTGETDNTSACPDKYFRDYGSHIYIKNSTPWDYKTSGTVAAGKASFYNGILHEIGHCLNLQHVNNSSDLMYFTTNTAITNLTTASAPVVGAETTVNESKSIIWDLSKLHTLGKPCDPVGFYDMVSIQNPEPERVILPFLTNGLPPNTYIMNPCSTVNFNAIFVTGDYPYTYPISFDWSIVLYRADRSEYVYAQQDNMPVNTVNPIYYYTNEGCFWQFTSGSLPAYDWLYDPSGNIYGIVEVVVHVSDGDIISDKIEVGVVPTNVITGPNIICCDGSTFTLTNPPSGTIYWTVSNSNIFNVNSTGNPTTVTRTGTGTGSVTLSARTGSISGTVLAVKTITPCAATTTFANQTVNTSQTVGACDINIQNVIVNAELTIKSTGVITVQDNVIINSPGKLILETLNSGRVVIDDKFDLSAGGFEIK